MNDSYENTAQINFAIRLKALLDEADALHAEAVRLRVGAEIIGPLAGVKRCAQHTVKMCRKF